MAEGLGPASRGRPARAAGAARGGAGAPLGGRSLGGGGLSLGARIGAALALLAVAWLPGAARAGTLREWLAWGAFPLVAVVGLRLSPTRHVAPWAVVAVAGALWMPWLADPGGGLQALVRAAGWCAWLAAGVAVARAKDEPALGPWLAGAGLAAAAGALSSRAGAFGNADLLAGFLVGTSLFTAEALLRSRRAWIGVSLAAQLAALVRCGSLGAWLAVGAGAVAWLAGSRPTRRRSILLLPVALALSLLFPQVREQLAGRWYLLQVSARAAAHALPAGAGPGAFHAAFLEAQAARLATHPDERALWTNAHHAHAEPMQALVELGPLGLLLLLAPVALALRRGRAGAAGACVVGYSLLGLVSLPLYEAGAAALACLAAGLAIGGRPEPAVPDAPRPFRRALALGGALVLLLATADLAGDRLLAAGARAGDAGLLAWSERLSLRPARALQHRAQLAAAPEARARLLAQALARDPSAGGWLQLGNARAGAGDLEGAVAAWREAVRLHPRLFAGHANLAIGLARTGDAEAARRHALRARSLRPHDPRLAAVNNLLKE